MRLTKSLYKEALTSPRHAWAKVNAPAKYQTEDSPEKQFRSEQGDRIEALAQEYSLFQEGDGPYEVRGDWRDMKGGFHETIQAIEEDWPVIFQATAVSGALAARADMLKWNPETSKWDMYEVKSGKKLEPEYLDDAGFQRVVFEQAGIPIGDVFIMHPDSSFVKQGEILPDELFKIDKVTEELIENSAETRRQMRRVLRMLTSEDVPAEEPCAKPADCPCPEICHPDLPERNIYSIPRLSAGARAELIARGEIDLADIDLVHHRSRPKRKKGELKPPAKLTPTQCSEVAIVQKEEIDIDAEKTLRLLSPRTDENPEGLEYPVYFLDYETTNPAIPIRDGDSPYDFVVFQYSLHRLDEPGGSLQTVVHSEFLARDPEESEIELVEQLTREIGEKGTIFIWNKSFEPARNQKMAEKCREFHDRPDLSEQLLAMNERMFDLADFVTKRIYKDHRLLMNKSIKSILPLLAPELSYEILGIQNGSEAYVAWHRACFEDIPEEERQKIWDDLLEYCALDTMAMVRLFFAFREMAAKKMMDSGEAQKGFDFE